VSSSCLSSCWRWERKILTPEEIASSIVDSVPGGLDYRAYEVTKKNIAEAIRGGPAAEAKPTITEQVAALRGDLADKWVWPDVKDSCLFLVTEMGELFDAVLRCPDANGDAPYARCNPRTTTVGNIADEMADMMIMLATLALAYNVCLEDALKTKIAKLRERFGSTEEQNQQLPLPGEGQG
jgi:NTP pyrophosphatase (non-canonical NTP hydrolase)